MNKIKYVLFCMAVMFFMAACNNNGNEPKKGEGEKHVQGDVTVAAWTDSIAGDSTRADFYLHRAEAYMRTNQIAPAMMDINKSISLDPRNVEAYLFLSDIYYALGDETNIKATLNRAEEIAPTDARPMLKQAELCLMQEDYNLSMAYIDKALNLNKYNPRAYYLKGVWFMTRQDTAQAINNFLIAREQDGGFFDPVREIGLIYSAQNNPLAESFLKSAVAQFPEQEIMRYELALFLQDHDKPDEAMSHYDTLLVTNPNSSRLFFNKGYVYLVYFGDNAKAVEHFDKALSIDKNYTDALYNKGRALEQMGDYRSALDVYSQVLKQQPDYELAIAAMNRINNQSEE